jgi:hypothetical protein
MKTTTTIPETDEKRYRKGFVLRDLAAEAISFPSPPRSPGTPKR